MGGRSGSIRRVIDEGEDLTPSHYIMVWAIYMSAIPYTARAAENGSK